MSRINKSENVKKDIKQGILVISCVIISLGLFYYMNKTIELKHEYDQLMESGLCTHDHSKGEFYEFNFEMNCKMTGIVAPNILCSESDKDDHILSDIVKQGPMLVYRFSDNNCTPCFIEELDSLQLILPEKCDYIHLLCSYKSPRELKILRITNNVKLPAYVIPFDAFDWPAEENKKPYYFVLHPDMKISHIYVPDKKYPELNKQYLEGIKRLLSE